MIYINAVAEKEVFKLAIVDRDPLSRAQACEIMTSDHIDQDLIIVWKTESYDRAILKFADTVPDLLILTFYEYNAELVLFLSALSKKFPTTRILLVSATFVSPNTCYLLLMTGIDGYMLKEKISESLLSVVSVLLKGTYCFSECFLRGLMEASEAMAPAERVRISDCLTDSERNVFRLMVKGLSNNQIAITLGLAERGVRFHLRNIYDKLGVEGRGQALLKFYNAEVV